MNLAAFTTGDISIGSSRLRSFNIFNSNVWKDHSIVFNPRFSSIHNFQWIHIQKMFTPKFIFLVIYARLIGKFIIFDIDDEAKKITHHIAIFIMIILSNKVVTDNDKRKQVLIKRTKRKDIEVISDTLDAQERVNEKVNFSVPNNGFQKEKSKSVILWIGNVANFNSFKNLIESDDRFYQYEIIVITDISISSKVVLSHPNYKSTQWSLHWYDELDTSNRYFMLLNHDDPNDEASFLKSENKMVMAIYHSIIPIISNTFSYVRLAKKLDAEFLIFKKNQYPYDLIKNIDSRECEWFSIFFEKSINYVQNNFNSEFLGQKLLSIYNESLK